MLKLVVFSVVGLLSLLLLLLLLVVVLVEELVLSAVAAVIVNIVQYDIHCHGMVVTALFFMLFLFMKLEITLSFAVICK